MTKRVRPNKTQKILALLASGVTRVQLQHPPYSFSKQLVAKALQRTSTRGPGRPRKTITFTVTCPHCDEEFDVSTTSTKEKDDP